MGNNDDSLAPALLAAEGRGGRSFSRPLPEVDECRGCDRRILQLSDTDKTNPYPWSGNQHII